MRFDVISLFPEMVRQMLETGVTGRALRNGLLELAVHNPRDWAADRHRTVDDRPYGGGPGMVMAIEPLRTCVQQARAMDDRQARVVYLSPQGAVLNHDRVARLATEQRLILLCGRYEGIDERLLQAEVDEELSIGDYVLSGGELAAAVVMDAVARQIPGVLGDADSAAQDSFATGLLDCPHYTRPEQHALGDVPEVLLSGNHAAIARWRRKQALGRTWQRRPDLLQQIELKAEDHKLLQEYIDEQHAPRGDEPK